MKDFLVVTKRSITRNKAPFEEHFICTKGKSPLPYGVWLNIPKLRSTSDEDLAQTFVELIEWLKG